MKKARKKKDAPNWMLLGAIVLVVAMAGWQYLKNGVVGSEAGTGKNILWVSKDGTSPLARLTIGGTSDELDSVWQMAFQSDDINSSKVAVVTGIKFTISNTKGKEGVITAGYLRQGGSSVVLARAVPTGDHGRVYLPFTFTKGIPIRNGSSETVKLSLDFGTVDGITIKNDERYGVDLDHAPNITVGLISPTPPGRERVQVIIYQYHGVTNYLVKTKPTIVFAKDTPSGVLVPGPNSLIAKVKVTADAAGDVSFTKASRNYLVFKLNSIVNDNQQTTRGWKIVDLASGVALASSQKELESGADIVCDFSLADFWVGAGSTKTLAIYADTGDYEDTGDSLQVWLDSMNNQLGWSIEGLLGNYHHGDILFRGKLFGGTLVKS